MRSARTHAHQAARTLALRTSGVTYPGSLSTVSAVRTDLRAQLRDCPRADDVIICASQLAANAALHSHSRLPGGTFTVRAAINPGRHYIRIEVEDNGGPWISAPDDRQVTMAWTSFALSPKSGASMATTRPALPGHTSTGPSSRD